MSDEKHDKDPGNNPGTNEGFMSRWSRRKQAVTESETEVQSAEAELVDTESEAEAIETEPEVIELTDADMPDIETLDENSDYSGFMSPKVSEELRKLALRKMFKGTVFHHRDGLDDYDDDFTKFAKLGDTITSDMKHMAAVEARRQLEAATKSNPPQEEPRMPTPRELALANLQEYTAEPTGQVEYRSGGKVLVIGGENALLAATQMQPPLKPEVLLTEHSELAEGKSFVTLQGEREITLDGWLGSFELELSDNMGNSEILTADAVLDMSSDALMTQQIKAPGYYHADADSLDEALEEMADLEGTFAKPRYFDYNPDICAHGSSGLGGCTNCLDACPTEAIISIGEKIEVEAHLCQGGGTCATVCPTGAIRYNYPAPGYHVDQLRRMLKSWRDADGGDVTVLLHSSENTPDIEALPEHILPFPLEELASAGADIWSATLSFGAKQILLLDGDDTPPVSRQHLRHQISVLSTQLAGLGYPDDVVRLIPALPDDTQEWADIFAVQDDTPLMPYFPPATQSGMNDKRQQWVFALDHLYKHSIKAEEQIPLPAGSPFGRIKVDQDACTLCMACTTVCPASALSGGTDSPQLRMFPANCVQCGLCDTGCPEKAITLEPLFIANREVRNRTQLLHEEAAFHCISCGKAFASQSIISTMLSKLQGHPMFQSERAQKRLKMCEDCRVVDAVQDDEAMGQPSLGSLGTDIGKSI
uniref:Iron-sulfur cluster-binding protein n=1 Tax=uncultured Thiotrichaceae bacterium TaxID=298394 RepID=A0A6S6UE05_9GAMM|nr:MAG: Iron-sulfur cluster-binding protein [uncultured Thiotrichaceae bacterium]